MSIQLHCATINVCNATCGFCIYAKPENTIPKGTMTMELFRKIIDEAATIPQIDCISFSALGEPTLDRFLVERVAYVKEKCPHWREIELYTNGSFLPPEKTDALVEAGLSRLCVSLNAVHQKQHESIMGIKGKFDKITENIRYALRYKDKVEILVKAVTNGDHFTDRDAAIFTQQWGTFGIGGHGQIVVERNWADQSRTLPGEEPLDPNSCCFRALGQISILYDGKVTMCCFDPLNKFPLGDLSKQTIREIYNSGKYVKFREAHNENRAAEYDLCAKCTRV